MYTTATRSSSFYKVIESPVRMAGNKGAWIDANLDALTDNTAARVAELRANGLDVGYAPV